MCKGRFPGCPTPALVQLLGDLDNPDENDPVVVHVNDSTRKPTRRGTLLRRRREQGVHVRDQLRTHLAPEPVWLGALHRRHCGGKKDGP